MNITVCKLPILVLAVWFAQQNAELVIQDPIQIAGKRVRVLRMPLCQPGSFKVDLTHSGETAKVLSVKASKSPKVSERVLSRLTPEVRSLMEDQQRAATIVLEFEDGTRLDSCAAIGPRQLSEYIELGDGETLEPVTIIGSPGTPTSEQRSSLRSETPQECPIVVTKVVSSDGGFAHQLADALTTSEFERQLDRTINQGKNKHYLDMRARNMGKKPIRAFESAVIYANVMGDETLRDVLISQNKKPVKPGDEIKTYFMDRVLHGRNGEGDVTVYIERIRFEDGTFWKDNGSHSCSLTSRIKS